jgi:hypothetical protein
MLADVLGEGPDAGGRRGRHELDGARGSDRVNGGPGRVAGREPGEGDAARPGHAHPVARRAGEARDALEDEAVGRRIARRGDRRGGDAVGRGSRRGAAGEGREGGRGEEVASSHWRSLDGAGATVKDGVGHEQRGTRRDGAARPLHNLSGPNDFRWPAGQARTMCRVGPPALAPNGWRRQNPGPIERRVRPRRATTARPRRSTPTARGAP